jgi:hypothetical protein
MPELLTRMVACRDVDPVGWAWIRGLIWCHRVDLGHPVGASDR